MRFFPAGARLVENHRFLLLFSLMFGIVSLLNLNYSLLRSARNALVVTDLGSGAASIPVFELCGTMPGAILMVFLLSKLLSRFSIHKVFLITLTTFSAFFLFFAVFIYPSIHLWKGAIASWDFLPGHTLLSVWLPQLFSMLFFVMAELWKIALLTVLFWGLVNQYIALSDAKKFYAPLMLGGSVGTMLAGPIIRLCTSNAVSGGSWVQSLTMMMLVLSILALFIAWFYTKLWTEFAGPKKEESSESHVSMWESIQLCLKSKYLLLLAWLTIADYIAYTLGEVVFLDVLKQKFPSPIDFCNYNGKLSFYSGLLTATCALIVSPLLMRRCKWTVVTLATPVCLLITEGAFFFTLWTGSITENLNLLILLGTIFFCVVRAAKYTLFDTSKEISFLLLPPIEKMQGKLIIDGMCSRLGRGGASFLSIFLIQLCGGVIASSAAAGGVALLIGASCVLSTVQLGKLVEKLSRPKSAVN